MLLVLLVYLADLKRYFIFRIFYLFYRKGTKLDMDSQSFITKIDIFFIYSKNTY